MYCKKCGNWVDENVAFCPNCGEPAPDGEKETGQEDKRSKNILICIIAGLLVLSAGAMGTLGYLKTHQEELSGTAQTKEKEETASRAESKKDSADKEETKEARKETTISKEEDTSRNEKESTAQSDKDNKENKTAAEDTEQTEAVQIQDKESNSESETTPNSEVDVETAAQTADNSASAQLPVEDVETDEGVSQTGSDGTEAPAVSALRQQVDEEVAQTEASYQVLEQEAEAATSQIEINQNAGSQYTLWDDELNQLWAHLKDSLDTETMDTLTQEQLQWIQDRDAQIDAASADFQGGTGESMVRSLTGASLTRERVYALKEYIQ